MKTDFYFERVGEFVVRRCKEGRSRVGIAVFSLKIFTR